ncbi:hypothetical protein SLS60_005634 [Paraconiothyrium brasiliense]|uniref:Uncharacterized protein n=1 Tax=Paraconiothyrium brasiliense TaxID=300254 RepID=A0ABR3RI76_9PLEO
MTSRPPSHLRPWRVAVNTILELVKRQNASMLSLPSPLLIGITLIAYYFFLKKFAGIAQTSNRSKSSRGKEVPSDSEFIASIIEKRERSARERADQLNKLKSADIETDDEFEALPNANEVRGASCVGSRKRYSHWAGQARTRRKLAAAKRRVEALNKERDGMMSLDVD